VIALSEMTSAQIASIRTLSDGGQHVVTIEKSRPNGDVIVKRVGRFYLIDQDGTTWKDDQI